jgi:hypothetical protein
MGLLGLAGYYESVVVASFDQQLWSTWTRSDQLVELNALDLQLLFMLIYANATKVQRTILFVENHYTIRIQVQRTVILIPLASVFKKFKQIFFFIVNFIFYKHLYVFFPE